VTKRRYLEEGSLFQKKYRIGKVLGEGGMGVVYAAVQEPSGLPVAIKIISAGELSARDLQAERALREARVLAKLSHNSIVRLYDFDQTAECDFFIVMELVEGDTLRALITRARKRGELLDRRQVLHIMANVADAVGAAHKAGVVHRDLKPDNVMVTAGGLVRVLDFGLAKNESGTVAPPSGVATSPTNTPGTPRYMAPEQVRGREIDARTDIYSIGVTLYEAFTGRTPYDRKDDDIGLPLTEVMAQHCFAKPTSLATFVPGFPERIAAIVFRCLAKEPSDRYQTTRDLASDLRAALADELDDDAKAKPASGVRKAVDVRETEPPYMADRPVLPFVASAPAAAYLVRETVPMAPPARPPQPTYSSAQPQEQRGVGYTTKMQRPSAAEIDAAEAAVARARPAEAGTAAAQPASAVSMPEIVSSVSSVVQVAENSSCTTSGIHLRQPTAASAELSPERRNEPPVTPATPLAARTPRATRREPPLHLAPVAGSVLAAVLAIVLLATHRGSDTKPPSPMPSATGVGTTASADDPSMPATTSTAAPEAPAPSPEATVMVATPPVTPSSLPASTAVPAATQATSSPPIGGTTAQRPLKSVAPPPADATSRPGKKPITPPPWPADDTGSRAGKRPIRPPPRPGEVEERRSNRLFGAEP
jgi:serine/threonine-protein kinase